MAKAVFIGINYYDISGTANLKNQPWKHAKSMLLALTTRDPAPFTAGQCLFFTDKPDAAFTEDHVKNMTVEKPTKGKVTRALTEMVAKAKDGESLLVYFCGHGGNEEGNSRGYLKTLNSDLKTPDVFYSTELNAIMKKLSSGVNITFVIHCCYSGAMFSYGTEMRGVALTSVGHKIPSAVTTEGDVGDDDFSHRLVKEIRDLPRDKGKGDPAWPTYEKMREKVKDIIVTGTMSDGTPFRGNAKIYHAPGKKVTDKFLY